MHAYRRSMQAAICRRGCCARRRACRAAARATRCRARCSGSSCRRRATRTCASHTSGGALFGDARRRLRRARGAAADAAACPALCAGHVPCSRCRSVGACRPIWLVDSAPASRCAACPKLLLLSWTGSRSGELGVRAQKGGRTHCCRTALDRPRRLGLLGARCSECPGCWGRAVFRGSALVHGFGSVCSAARSWLRSFFPLFAGATSVLSVQHEGRSTPK